MKDNGKTKGQLMNEGITLQLDDDLRKALVKDDTASEVNEPTKYILLNDALVQSVDDERVKHFTKYIDSQEVFQMNDIETHADLIEIVFGNTRGLQANGDIKLTQERIKYRGEQIKKVANLFRTHAHNHMDNMMSHKGDTRNALVYALKQDAGVPSTDKEVKKLFGGRN